MNPKIIKEGAPTGNNSGAHNDFVCCMCGPSDIRKSICPEIDGFALVSFDSLDSMKERFFGDDTDRDVIYQDVASFADPKSPRRVVSTETIYGTRPPTPKVVWPQG